MNGIQSKDHRIGTYEIKKPSLSCFDDKIYILNNGYYALALGYQSYLYKNSYLDNYSEQLFCQAVKILFQFLV